MSYCRFIEADVYIFESVSGYLECCGCSITEPGSEKQIFLSFRANTVDEMLEHIAKHRKRGEFVPEDVDERLREEKERGLDEKMRNYREPPVYRGWREEQADEQGG